MSLWMGKKISATVFQKENHDSELTTKNGPIGRIISRQLEFVEKTRIEGLKSCLPFKHHFFKALIKQGSHKIFLTTTC